MSPAIWLLCALLVYVAFWNVLIDVYIFICTRNTEAIWDYRLSVGQVAVYVISAALLVHDHDDLMPSLCLEDELLLHLVENAQGLPGQLQWVVIMMADKLWLWHYLFSVAALDGLLLSWQLLALFLLYLLANAF